MDVDSGQIQSERIDNASDKINEEYDQMVSLLYQNKETGEEEKRKFKKYINACITDIIMLAILIFVYKKIISLAGAIWLAVVLNDIASFVLDKYKMDNKGMNIFSILLVISFLISICEIHS